MKIGERTRLRRPSCCVYLAVIVLAAGREAAAADESSFRVDPPEINFLQTHRGQTPGRRVRIVNVSDRTVEIRRVVPECDCVGVSIDGPTSLRPSGVVELNVSYATMRQPAGPAEKKITIEYEDQGPRRWVIPVRIDIQPGVIVEPSLLSFGKLPRGESRTLELALHTPDETPFALGGTESSDPQVLKADRSREVHARLRNHHRVSVTLGPIEEPGRFAGHIVLFTQHWSDQELEIPVFAEVTGSLTVSPSTIYRSRVRPGTMVEETLTLTGAPADIAALRLVTETDTLSPLSPELIPVEGRPDQVLLRLSVPAGFAGTHLSGKLALQAGKDGQALARLTVFLYLLPTERDER